MDSMTHIYFAARLLESAQASHDAIAASLFPQIDRKPAYYHRLYAHSVPKAPKVIEAARFSYWTQHPALTVAEASLRPDNDYFIGRLREDADRIKRYVTASPFATNSTIEPKHEDAVLAFVSHLYNDQYNNPIQAFVPYSVYPSGAWDLWESIDSSEFRWFLYSKKSIEALRAQVFDQREWREKYSASALTAGMIKRLADNCSIALPLEVVLKTLATVGLEELYDSREVNEATAFLLHHERILEEAIKHHSLRVSPEEMALRQWAGEGY